MQQTKNNRDTKNKKLLSFNKWSNFYWFDLDYIIEEELVTIDVIILGFDLFACLCKFYIKNFMMYVFFYKFSLFLMEMVMMIKTVKH